MLGNAGEKIGNFIWGANGEQLTPEQVARRREMANAAQGRAGDTSPVGHWTQGAARVVDALGGVVNDRRADRNEASGLASADEYVNSNPVLAGLLGGGGGSPTQMSSMSTPVDPSTGLPASIVQSESGGNWNALNSEGYGGRGQFGEDRLADAARAGIIPAGMTGADYSQAPEGTQLAVESWHKADILNDLGQYVGVDVDGAGPIPPLTENSILSVAHLGGTGGARRFVESGGSYNPSDSNGTSLSDYATMHAGGSPTQMSTRGTSQPSGDVIAALSGAMSNPWVAEKYGPVIEQLMGQERRRGDMQFQQQLAQSDPMYQAKLAQLTAPPPAPGAPDTQKIYDPETGQEQIVQWNGAEWTPLGGVAAPSGPMVSVENNMPGQNKFDEAFAAGDAATIAAVSDSGLAAQRNLTRIDKLESLLTESGTGAGAALALKAGEFGIDTDGLSELQAAQALINSLVPEQRHPGSGPMSDADLALFKQSLPRIINQPGGNAQIVSTMRAIAMYDAEGAEIVQQLRNGDIDRAQAFNMLRTRQNPLEGLDVGPASPEEAAPSSGLTADDLKYLGFE